MATNVGTLRANLTLDTSNFTRNMGKAVSAAQRLGSELSSALGRKSQSFSTIGDSASKAATSMGTLKESIQEVSAKAQEVTATFAQMSSSMAATNPFAAMQSSLDGILMEVRTLSTSVTGLNTELTNTNTQLERVKTVMAGNSNFKSAEGSTKKVTNNLKEASKAAKDVKRGIEDTTKGASSANANVQKLKQSLTESSFRAKDIARVLQGIVISQAFYRLLSIMSELVSGSMEFMQNMEQTQLSFQYLLGDADAAASMVEKLQDFAIASPLDTSGAADATRYLLNMGFAAQNVVDVLSVITDAAVVSGKDVKDTVQSISVALGQMLQSGTASAQEIRQLYNAGVPVVKILNEQLGLTGKEVKNIGDLAIDSETVVSAILQGLQDEFAGASQAMQETVKGAMSAIMDSVYVFNSIALEGPYEKLRVKLVEVSNAMQYLVTIARKLGPGGVFETLVPDKNWQTILRNIIGAFQQLGMALQYWAKIIGTIFAAVGQEIAQILNVILPPITILLNFIMKFIYGLLQAAPAIKYFVAALTLLAIAMPIAKILMTLWKIVGLGGICAKVAKYVMTLAKALQTLIIAHPVIAAVTAITVAILAMTGVLQKAIDKIKELISLLGGKLASFGGKDKTIDPGLNIGYDPNEILQPVDREKQKQAEDYTDTMEELSDALEDVGDNAKKAGKSLKNNFNQSFDEVFDIIPKTSSASDLLGFNPEDLDLTPLEDFVADLSGLTPTFDFSGTLDDFMDAWSTMIANMIDFAKEHIGSLAIALAGLLAGLALGNPWLALAYALVALFWEDLCEAFGIDVPNEAGIAAAIGSGIGTVIGYLIGGKLGAYIGGAVGLLASTVFSIILDRIAEAFDLGDYSKAASAIGQSIGMVIGTAIGGLLGGPVGAAIGAAIGNFAGGVVGLIWGGLVEKLGASTEQGIADLTAALEGFISGGIASALGQISLNTVANELAGSVGVSLASTITTGLAGGLVSGGIGLLATAIWDYIGKELQMTADDMANSGIGGIIGSVVGALVGLLITALTDGFGAMTIPVCTGIGNAIGQGIGLFANDIASWCEDSFTTIKEYLATKVTEFQDSLGEVDWSSFSASFGTDLGKALGDGVNTAIEALDNGINDIQQALWDLGDWLIDEVPKKFLGLGESIGTALGEAVTAIVDFFTVTIPDTISNIDLGEIFHDLGYNIGKAIGDSIKTIVNIVDTIESIDESIKEFFKNLLASFIKTITETDWAQLGKDVLKAIGTALIDVFIAFPTSVLESIGTFVYGIFDGFLTKVQEIDWLQLGQYILDGILYIFTEAPGDLLNAIGTAISNFFSGFVEGLCSAFGINSPAEEMKPYGDYILQGILQGILNAISSINTWIKSNIYEPFKNALTTWFALSKWLEFGKKIITGIKNGVTNALSNITSWIKTNIFDKFKTGLDTWFSSTSASLLSVGKNMIQGILSGIKDGLANIKSWLKDNVYDSIVGGVKSLFGIASPAKAMKPLGAFVSQGFGLGITDEMAYVIKDILASMKDVMGAFELGDNPLVAWADDVWMSIDTKISMAINKIKELMDLTNQGISLQANLSGFNYTREGFNYTPIPQDTEGADYFADALVSRLGPIIAQERDSSNNGTPIETLRPLYVGTLIADDRGLRELERKMRVISDAEDERRGR